LKRAVALDLSMLRAAAWTPVWDRVLAYWSLTKPRLVLMVLITVAVGYAAGTRGPMSLDGLWAAVWGSGLVAGGAGAINQWLERVYDARMRRTASRALPSGRITPLEAAMVGLVLAVLGVALLAVRTNWLAAAVALATFVLYCACYTPLKPHSTLNTVVGAIPGALPPVIGWAAASGRLEIQALALFLIVFLWQFPHFLAIAWIYREDYRKAGFYMLTRDDEEGRETGRHAVSYALALLPVGLLPAVIGLAGSVYFVGAFLLGLAYLKAAIGFCREVSDSRARRLLRASFLYLPAVLGLLLLNPSV